MGFGPRVKRCSLKGSIHGGVRPCVCTPQELDWFPGHWFHRSSVSKTLTRQPDKNPPQKHLGEQPIAFEIRQGRARENTLWGAVLPQQDKRTEILLGLFQLSLLGNLSLDPRCFIALDVSCAMKSLNWTLAEDAALMLEPVEDQVCPLKHLTTCWCNHKQVGHSHGAKGIPCLWDSGVLPILQSAVKSFESFCVLFSSWVKCWWCIYQPHNIQDKEVYCILCSCLQWELPWLSPKLQRWASWMWKAACRETVLTTWPPHDFVMWAVKIYGINVCSNPPFLQGNWTKWSF